MEEEAVEMAVDTRVPNGDVSLAPMTPANVLFVSEEGSMQSVAFGLADAMNVRYFQRLPGISPYLFPEESRVQQVDSWRPHITWANVIVVDDPSFVARLAKDFKLDDLVIMYMVSSAAYEEVGRLTHWMNPLAISVLRDAMENVDISPSTPDLEGLSTDKPAGFWKRIFRRLRA